jgi:hypothetical protein
VSARGDHYAPTWQEMAEHDERERRRASEIHTPGGPVSIPTDVFRVPAWQSLLAEGVAVRSAFMNDDASFAIEETDSPIADHGVGRLTGINAYPVHGRTAFARLYAPSAHAREYGTIVAPPPEAFTITNVQHFQFLPSIERIKKSSVRLALHMASMQVSPAVMIAQRLTGVGPRDGLLLHDAQKQNVELTVRAEQSHMLYHKAMWRAHGRRVVVLDETTYTLLAHTDLPAFPASTLAAPWPAFYIKLPHHAFEFEIHDVRTDSIDRRWVEGVSVAIDHVEPDHDGPRELAFMVMGEDEGFGSEGRNCAFASIRFGPDATLNEFSSITDARGAMGVQWLIGGRETGLSYGGDGYVGSEDLTIHVPRVIVGLMLYLASEHPDVVPIDPAPRRTYHEIRSARQRAAALETQAAKLKHATRLPVLVIGSRLNEHARTIKATLERDVIDDGPGGTTRKRWILDRSVWVRGHWRQQAHGPGRLDRRPVWIRPYVKGPDAAESMAIRAARVPRAQMNPRHEDVGR